MAYNTGKKCFFCGEGTLTGKKVGKKVICSDCMNDLDEALGLRYYKMKDED